MKKFLFLNTGLVLKTTPKGRESVFILEKDFILTIILKEEAKKYSLPKEKAENLLNLIITQNKNGTSDLEEKDEIIEMIRSAVIVSIERSENQITIKMA